MKKYMKIGIVVLLVIAIGGIYYVKNFSSKNTTKNTIDNSSKITENVDEIMKVKNGEIKKIVVMQLSTSTCPACKEMYPIMESINKKYGDKIITGVVYLDNRSIEKQAMQLANDYSVRVVPTIVVLDEEGQQVIRHEGILEEAQIVSILSQMGVK